MAHDRLHAYQGSSPCGGSERRQSVHGPHKRGLNAKVLIANRGYDTGEIVGYVRANGMEVVISPRKNRKEMRDYDEYLYTIRHLVENAFLEIKRWREVATRYAKTLDGFTASIQVR